jgi:formylglycine-generating enzyme required for sulfatase activity
MLKRFAILLILAGAMGAVFAQKAAVSDDLVRVESASFILGDEIADPMFYGSVFEVPQGEVRVGAFFIAPAEVTVDEFAAFVKDTGYKTRAESSGKGGYVYLNGKWVLKKDASWKNSYLPAADTGA